MAKPAFFTVSYIEVVPSAADAAAAALGRYRDVLAQEPAVIGLDVFRRSERAGQLVVLAGWTSAEAFAAHAPSSALADLNGELGPLLAAPTDTREHEPLAVGPSAERQAGAISVVTHVDVVPTYKEDGADALVALADQSRAHGGNVRFDVWRQTNRPNHFSVVETWSNATAREAHVAAAETRAFRSKLAIMTGALYDERLYAAI